MVRALYVVACHLMLTCCSEEMRSFFDPCVGRIVELIDGQIRQVEQEWNRVKVNSSLFDSIGT